MANRTETYNEAVRANLPSGMTWDGRRYVYNNHKFTSYNRAIWYYNYLERTGGGFTPADLFSGGVPGHYHSAPDTGVGSPLDTWTDLSGNGNNLTAPNSDARPTVLYDSAAGLNYVAFDGVDDVLEKADFAALPFQGGCAHFSLTRFVLTSSRSEWWTWQGSGEGNFANTPRAGTTVRVEVNNERVNYNPGAGFYGPLQVVVFRQDFASGVTELRINGVAVAQNLNDGNPITDTNLNATFPTSLGGDGNPHSHYDYGYISKSLTTQELADLESYLMARGGIS